MGLKYHVEKLEDVEESLRGLYQQNKDGGFDLAVEGIDTREELKRAKDHEVAARKKAEEALKEMQAVQTAREEKIRKEAEEAARKNGDVQALEKSWQEKLERSLAEVKAQYEPKVQSLQGNVERLLVDNVATSIAREIAIQGSDQVLMPHIRSRLRIAEKDGELVTTVVDAKGQPSAFTLEDLKKEFVGNKAFAPLIVGTKASGGGAGGAGGGGAAGGKSITRADFEALNPQQRVEAMKAGTTVTD